MPRNKFSQPPSTQRADDLFARDRQPLSGGNLTSLALHYYFALNFLNGGLGKPENFVLLAQHLHIARSLGKIGCRCIPGDVMDTAERAIVDGTRRGLLTGTFAVEAGEFAAIQAFLFEHDEQLKEASSAAVSVALADLRVLQQNGGVGQPL